MNATPSTPDRAGDPQPAAAPVLSASSVVALLRRRWRLLIAGPLLAGLVVLGITFVVPPVFTASVTFIPPQQSQGGAAAALASLGSLASLAGIGGGGRSQPELYASLLQRATIADRMIEEFKLVELYDAKFRVDARKELTQNTRITVGRKDGLITIEVDDPSPDRAAAMANRYVEELRKVTSTLAVSEAQQRRQFFEEQLKLSHERLINAQRALQASGFNPGALKTEPKAAAENYAKIRAEVTAGEVRLQALRGTLTDTSPEVRQQQVTLGAMRQQLARLEQTNASPAGSDYVGRYREFKYAEALFEVYARQFELARVDEAREGALIQVVDKATPPERRSWPKRAQSAVIATVLAFFALLVFVLGREFMRKPATPAAEDGVPPL